MIHKDEKRCIKSIEEKKNERRGEEIGVAGKMREILGRVAKKILLLGCRNNHERGKGGRHD